jgi:hypothetical protein
MTSSEYKQKLEVIEFWLDGISSEMIHIKKNKPTKKVVLENLDQWVNTLDNIKGIIDYGIV